MPNPTPAPVHRVCLLILTYKRNEALLSLIHQIRSMLEAYHGHNRYELCVADSDRSNPLAPLPADLNVRYSVNPGSGFDDNIYHFWRDNIEAYDFIFSISDDDLFTPWLNPLYLLDAAMDTGHQMVIFKHRCYKTKADKSIELDTTEVFPDAELLAWDKGRMLERVLTTLPSHIGLLYSTKLLKATLSKAAEFRNTLHLYAVPILFAAAANSILFVDYTLCLYRNDAKTDGAWSASADVLNGLVEFLKKLKKLLPPEMYAISERGFFYFYFRKDSWLRKQLADNPNLRSEEQIREMIAQG